jgi:2-methylaconitate cis-trans-isomerase PrpF
MADAQFMRWLEVIRREAGRRMGLGDVSNLVIPKPVLIAPARNGGSFAARYFMPHACHKALAVTGAVGLATAVATPGTRAAALSRRRRRRAASSSSIPRAGWNLPSTPARMEPPSYPSSALPG